MKNNTPLFLSFVLCLLLTQYKRLDGFMNRDDYFTQATTCLKNEIKITEDERKREKLVNAINYIKFVKTLFKE